MKIDDLENTGAPLDFAPRPRAAQDTAAAKRAAQPATEQPTIVRAVRPYRLYALLGGAVLFVAALTWQLNTPARPLALPAPTDAPRALLSAPTPTQQPTAAPVPTSAPAAIPTSAPLVPENGAGDVVGVLQEAPLQTGRGLTLEQPSYVENVGAQTPHSPRGGLCGPTGGDCSPGVPVEIDNNQYIANVGSQAPHKVR